MAEKALVLSADPWEMTDKDTGQIVKGVSFWYVNQYRDGENGQKPTKVSVSSELFDMVKGKLPALCELEFGSRPGAQGKATLTVVGAKVLKAVDFSGLFGASSKAV
jgi:hypothetical protein